MPGLGRPTKRPRGNPCPGSRILQSHPGQMDKRAHLLIGKLRGQGSLLKRATWPGKRDLPGLVGDMPRIVPPNRASNGNKAITGSGAVEWLTSQSLGECTVRARGGRLPRAQYIESGAAREHYKYVASIHYEGNHKNPTKILSL